MDQKNPAGKIDVFKLYDFQIRVTNRKRIIQRKPGDQRMILHEQITDLQSLTAEHNDIGVDIVRMQKIRELLISGSLLFRVDDPGIIELIWCDGVIAGQRVFFVDNKAVLYAEQKLCLIL